MQKLTEYQERAYKAIQENVPEGEFFLPHDLYFTYHLVGEVRRTEFTCECLYDKGALWRRFDHKLKQFVYAWGTIRPGPEDAPIIVERAEKKGEADIMVKATPAGAAELDIVYRVPRVQALVMIATDREWESLIAHAPAGKRDRFQWLKALVENAQESGGIPPE